jgi:L-2,4-diaminobutyrate decarboxylase
MHVDAAWGGALLLSEQYRHFLNGLELADSVTLDF